MSPIAKLVSRIRVAFPSNLDQMRCTYAWWLDQTLFSSPVGGRIVKDVDDGNGMFGNQICRFIIALVAELGQSA